MLIKEVSLNDIKNKLLNKVALEYDRETAQNIRENGDIHTWEFHGKTVTYSLNFNQYGAILIIHDVKNGKIKKKEIYLF